MKETKVKINYTQLYLNQFEKIVNRNLVEKTISNPDKTYKTDLGDKHFIIHTKYFQENQKKLLTLVVGFLKNNILDISYAFIVPENLKDLEPLKLLEEFVNQFGLDITIDSFKGKFIHHKTFWINSKEPTDLIKGISSNYFIPMLLIKFEDYDKKNKIYVHTAFCINMEKYISWFSSLNKSSWIFTPWIKLQIIKTTKDEIRYIFSFNEIGVFLKTNSHIIGVSISNNYYFGPKILGIEFEPWINLSIARDYAKNFVALFINATKLLEIKNDEIIYKLNEFKVEKPLTQKTQIIKTDIQKWIEIRKQQFKLKRETIDKYYLLSQKEQENQLKNRIISLSDLLKNYYSGKTYYLDDIVANLRSLLFYKKNSKNYDPLLLRIASYKEISLPVYIMPDIDNIAKVLIHEAIHKPLFLGLNIAQLEPEIPCIMLVDFQEYLELPSLYYEGEEISPLSLIEKLATTRSTAHFDQRIPKDIRHIENSPIILGQNSLEYYMLSFAKLTIELGKIVLKKIIYI